MKILKRRTAAPAPADMIADIRSAQAEHAAAVSAANQRLIESHSSTLSAAQDRQKVVREQIALLKAEDDGVTKVVEAAMASLDAAKL